ncbi:MAG: hypothetical protein GX202_02760 [Firmicutes bacterium]|nr:hypothetical protein [Bacillota bacterium]
MRLIFPMILGFLTVKVSLPMLAKLLCKQGIMKENYRREPIPAAVGLVFPLTLPLLFLVQLGLELFTRPAPAIDRGAFFAFLFLTTGFGLLGLADDLLKSDAAKGFRQHLRALYEGELTSGGLKAVFGFGFSLVFGIGVWLTTGGSWLIVFPSVLLAALAPNIVNLFDLRPGRAGKVFLAALVLLMVKSYLNKGLNPTLFLGAPVLGGVAAYLPHDLKGRAMLGDTGANFLGGTLGGLVVLDGDPVFTGLTLVFFIFLQLLAEKVSFTKIIEKNSILKFLDEMGRD